MPLCSLGPCYVVLKDGGKGSCSEFVMTAAARMASTSLWHGCFGGVSARSSAANAQRHGLGGASAHLQCVSFAIAPIRGWRCAEASSCKHDALEQRTTPNSPDEIYLDHYVLFSLQMMIVWCCHEIASAQLEPKGGSVTPSQFMQVTNTEDAARCLEQA